MKFVNLPAGNAQIIACDCVGTGEQDCVFQFRLVPLNGALALQFNPLATGVTGSYIAPRAFYRVALTPT